MNDSVQDSGSERPIRTGHHPSIIFVAYHFLPSTEVGARRVSALAQYLVEQGRVVAVVSAFAGLASPGAENSASARLAAYDIEHVPDRKSVVEAFLVNAKRWLRKSASVSLRASRHPTADLNVPVGYPAKSNSVIHRTLFTVLRVIDEKKGWSLRAGRSLRLLATRHLASVIVVSAPPVSPLCAAVFTARRLKLPIIVDLRDPITDNAASEQRQSHTRRWSARTFVERYVVGHADAVVTTTLGLRDRLRARYPTASARIACIYNGFDGDMTAAKLNTEHQLTVVFAGELYLNRNPFPFLEAIDRLLDHPSVDESRIRILFAGECEYHGGVSLRAWSSTRQCGRVLQIYPRLDASKLKDLYQEATLLLNFAEGQPIQVPAKTFELLSLGREVFVACEAHSDTAKVIAGIEGVFALQLSETERLDDLLRSLYRRHVVEGRMSPPTKESVFQYSRAIQNERYRTLIDRVGMGITPAPVEDG